MLLNRSQIPLYDLVGVAESLDTLDFGFLQDADQKKAVYYAINGTAIALITNAIDFRISHLISRLRLWIVTSSPFKARDLHAYVLKIYNFIHCVNSKSTYYQNNVRVR